MKRTFGTLTLMMAIMSLSYGQNSTVTDSTEFAFLPALSYNSDLGLIGGGLANWYIYKDQTRPFHSFISTAGILSTKGLASFNIKVDKPQISGSKMRLSTEFQIFRFFEDNYFGIGNYDELVTIPQDIPEYFLFQTFGIGFNADLRIPVHYGNNFHQLDAIANINFDYETPWDNGNSRLITLPDEQPLGFNGGNTFLIGTGFIWEGRDNEFRPTSGFYGETTFELGNTIWGSSYDLYVLDIEAAGYFTFNLIKDITFANRFQMRHTSGDVPYWKLAYAGNEETIRGYPSKRFVDDNVVIINSELRTWLFEIPSLDTRIGGNLFFDIGRTFNNDTAFSEWTQDLRYSFGFSGTASFFTPDFIIRGDVGFSEEDTGVYITAGYMF